MSDEAQPVSARIPAPGTPLYRLSDPWEWIEIRETDEERARRQYFEWIDREFWE